MAAKSTRRNASLEVKVRLYHQAEIALGPGKAELLGAIERTGSIREAAGALQMSYMRAWSLVKTMNRSFARPLVESARGGAGRGGAHLTEEGAKVLQLYQDLQAEVEQTARRKGRVLQSRLKRVGR